MHSRFSKSMAAATFFVTVSVLFLAACGGVGNVVKPLTAAQIYAAAQKPSSLKDTTFDLSFTLSTALTGSLAFTGGGKATTNPDRSDITESGSLLGVAFKEEIITDGNTTYTKTTPPTIPGDTKWTKGTSTASAGLGVDSSSFTNFGNLQNVTLVGTETLNGIQVYHLKGVINTGTPTAGTPTSTPPQEDLWVRTDNFYPVKVSANITETTAGQVATVAFVVTFKSWNTGITIAVPPPSDVETTP